MVELKLHKISEKLPEDRAIVRYLRVINGGFGSAWVELTEGTIEYAWDIYGTDGELTGDAIIYDPSITHEDERFNGAQEPGTVIPLNDGEFAKLNWFIIDSAVGAQVETRDVLGWMTTEDFWEQSGFNEIMKNDKDFQILG